MHLKKGLSQKNLIFAMMTVIFAVIAVSCGNNSNSDKPKDLKDMSNQELIDIYREACNEAMDQFKACKTPEEWRR